jgi:hypothetical protein
MAQVKRFASYDRDVTGEVDRAVKKLDPRDLQIQFLTTVVPDPKHPEVSKVLYEAYVIHTGTVYWG